MNVQSVGDQRDGQWQLSRTVAALMASLVLVFFYNDAMWELVHQRFPINELGNLPFQLGFALLITAIFFLILGAVPGARAFKLVAVPVFFSAAAASYFIDNYNIVVDKEMVRNLLESDTREAGELFSWKMALDMLARGAAPALLLYLLPLRQVSLGADFKHSLRNLVVTCLAIVALTGVFYNDFSLFFRTHPEIRYLSTPSNLLYYSARHLSGAYAPRNETLTAIDESPQLKAPWQALPKQSVTILVMGETARSANFSLSGYARETNPKLAQRDLLYFPSIASCGTSTATSLPCLFSDLPRSDFSVDAARSRENLLDLATRAGFDVLWRDNNTGCKGACARVETQNRDYLQSLKSCGDDGCHDGILLQGLDDYLDSAGERVLIVLHQLGNHGPNYARRYPAAFEQYSPVCDSADLSSCSQQALINGYDNAILYTDHFLDQAIALLEARSDRSITSMVYVSDHGESLGEGGLYLHGLPYALAPAVQKEVPMFFWQSEQHRQRFMPDKDCLRANTTAPASHDNLFHTLLGWLAIDSIAYQPELDLFASCAR